MAQAQGDVESNLPNTTTLALAEHREVSGSASALLGVSQFIISGLAAPLVGLGGAGSAVPMAVVMFGVVVAAAGVFLMLGQRSGVPKSDTIIQSRATTLLA